MAFNYEIPRITQPDEQSPESISPIYDDTFWEDDRTAIQKGHYWKRVFSTSVFCGQKVNVKFTTKIGGSQSLVKETSASLDIPIHALKATLGPSTFDGAVGAYWASR
jgi:hypothetical protein